MWNVITDRPTNGRCRMHGGGKPVTRKDQIERLRQKVGVCAAAGEITRVSRQITADFAKVTCDGFSFITSDEK